MAKEKGFKFFTDAKARKTQKRFAHFLRGYRKRQGLTQKQLASQLGYTELHYRKLESESADNTVIKSFDTLGFFAKLQNMTTVDFTSYIEQKPIETRKELFPWEVALLSAFTNLDVETRMAFVHGLCGKTTETHLKKLKSTIDLAVEVNKLLSDDQTEKALDFIRSLAQKR